MYNLIIENSFLIAFQDEIFTRLIIDLDGVPPGKNHGLNIREVSFIYFYDLS